MRDIKFRAWDNKNKRLVRFDVRKLVGHWSGDIFDYETQEVIAHETSIGETTLISDAPLMQYTGLKDKNGVEIYEGDILRNNKHCDQAVEVYWKGCEIADDNWIKFGEWGFRKAESDARVNYAIYQHAVEVIGNIHENPEILRS